MLSSPFVEDVSVPIDADAPGATLSIRAWRVRGDGTGPRVHLQAGLHADEIPGMLVLHLLLPRLVAAAEAGHLKGTITVVPQANPLGAGQFAQGRILGRYHFQTNRNFNRGFPDSVAAGGVGSAFVSWQARLASLARHADIVLDLHTDDEAVPYLYLHTGFWPAGRDLAVALGTELVILWEGDSGGAFEEVVIDPWLAESRLDGRLVSTIELRGQADVDETTAQADADGLYAFLCARGVIDAPATLPAWTGTVAPMGHMETVTAPQAGLIVFDVPLGAEVAAGTRFARIITRPGDPASEIPLVAPQAGRLVTRYRDRLIPRGDIAAKFACEGPSSTWSSGALDP
ncbi:succinylglutamate desuccinylase/aspartoacylase domain-containing protein [Segnochrobactrum spirostomi]|uniref:Succinylglutamate desuccinylase/aspartoacylase family protein n=1 Tax=Segnochrobactrum spirostomi TaxID=2608987 RepID=A0A6A7XZD6_9HYPH|nr:succinylglutamate desuccinylase/aspartoacylase family protein [Segnochrobactrum spirostomi]MQT11477.1 succinylglutamate desuccinylase/aspartoacylase family protein [Segnochrobactrum spirostomi]